MIRAGLIDRLQLFVIPVLLGAGVPLFPSEGASIPITLTGTESFGKGIVLLDFAF